MNQSKHLVYRPDIDGLRAIAILSVVLFHAGFRFITGGFSGVDIFFVISGFLITSNILKDLQHDKFSIAGFYERRIRRIFPALVVMCALTTLAACAILLPHDLRQFGSSLISSFAFNANFYFAGKTGYFDAPSASKPLLHIWSLSVEEQFYMVFPWLILGSLWYVKYRNKAYSKAQLNRLLVGLMAGLLITSIIMAELAVRQILGTQVTAFYMMPLRIWEFLCGAILVFLPVTQNRTYRQAMGMTGLVFLSVAMFGLSGKSPFPGLTALWPCVGAALIIQAGKTANDTFAGKLLSLRPMVFIGLISYSLYLWHWPLLVLPHIWNVNPVSPWARAIFMVIAFGLAFLSWKFVEMPVRTRRILQSRKSLFLAAFLAILAAASVSITIKTSQGWASRLPEEVVKWDEMRSSPNRRLKECFRMDNNVDVPMAQCVYGAADVTPTFALWGDSHADSLISPLGDRAEAHHKAILFLGLGSCAPLRNFSRPDNPVDKACLAFNEKAYNRLVSDETIHTVVLLGRWSGYLGDMPRDGFDYHPPFNQRNINEFQSRVPETVYGLLNAGKRVILVYPEPDSDVNVPTMLSNLILRGVAPETLRISRPVYEARGKPATSAFDLLDDKSSKGQLIRVYPAKLLCNQTSCPTIKDGKPLYYDDHHFSFAGAEIIANGIEPYLK